MCLPWGISGGSAGFFTGFCGNQGFLGRCPHYLPGLASVIENRCARSPGLAYHFSLRQMKSRSTCSVGSRPASQFSWAGELSKILARTWICGRPAVPHPAAAPCTLQLRDRRFWCGSTGVVSSVSFQFNQRSYSRWIMGLRSYLLLFWYDQVIPWMTVHGWRQAPSFF